MCGVRKESVLHPSRRTESTLLPLLFLQQLHWLYWTRRYNTKRTSLGLYLRLPPWSFIIHTPVLMCSSVPRPCSGVRITDEEMSLVVVAAMQYAGGTILPAATSSICEVNHCCPFWCGICRYCRTRHEHSSQYEGRQNSATYCSFCFQENSPPSPCFFDFCSASTLTLPQFVILSIACR